MAANYGGLYGMRHSGEESRSAYWQGVFLYGHIDFDNQVPGYSGYGLRQRYGGAMTAVSLEHGLTLRRTSQLTVEPQIQFLYTASRHGEFTDNLGALVSVGQGASLQGRAGVEIRKEVALDAKRKQKMWLRGDYVREFQGDTTALVSGEETRQSGGRSSYRLSLGGTLALAGNWRLAGEVVQSFGGERGCRGQWELSKYW